MNNNKQQNISTNLLYEQQKERNAGSRFFDLKRKDRSSGKKLQPKTKFNKL